MKNINDFSRFTALLLGLLYDQFPNPVPVGVDEMDESADKETLRTYRATVEFLKNEGFIQYRTVAPDNVFLRVVLTTKGLSLLNAIPDAITEKKRFIDMLKDTLKEGSKTALNTLVEVFLRESLNA